ncbi:uncharacterized protein SPSK_00708 [Sporothrix schenckii 1099-18]|uniref:Zn(2)-C6 fungal-type domain-containing protein n=1 Tax=Sporothrix schenckii 1099-18 TaxID=1397361 RepID=A0A0F2LVY2_SPOSC|nr:uncharacterized protein SPSK_00708 [Sporothrix schenckii 1099-18]KJR81632.1 hypothetical protein SPSK_00708 [Sporothrix schenckii 1099-18]
MSRHIKSRSGCRVCKAKRLKCDETTPACRNCINRGIACPGYRQVLRWSTKYENPAPKPTGGRRSSTAAAIPEFSELVTAASQSIKPRSLPKDAQTVPNAHAAPSESTGSFDAFDPFEPAVKTETAPATRQPLSQVRPAQPVARAPSLPVSSLSPASSTSSSSTASYGPHGPPVVPVLAENNVAGPYSFSYSMPPTSSAAATAPPQSSLIATTGHWQLTQLGGVSVTSFMDETAVLLDGVDHDLDHDLDHEQDNDESYTLELWQPERFTRTPYQLQKQPHPVRGLSMPGTSLVELWFSSVCGMWAAYDSPANPFRRLCSALWSSNEAVFFSLQTMAAASLPKRPPSVSEIVLVAPQMSTQALIHELQELFGPSAGVHRAGIDAVPSACDTSTPPPKGFPAGLLTSLFCMSSSLSWIDARQLGIQYLRNARSVIDLLDLRAAQLSADDRELLEFFRGCLLYEEMLRSIVSDDQDDIQALLAWRPPTVTVTAQPPGTTTDLRLHAWAGVPIVLIGLFGKVMALCRRSRKAWRTAARAATYQLLYQAMQDIQEGQALEAVLLAMEIPAPDPSVAATAAAADAQLQGHIYKAAEAFRLSSLLQLYQTFPDLVSQHQSPTGAGPGQTLLGPPMGDHAAPANGRWLLPLVLHMVDLIRGIPADSPMRCLQPLLCLCAGSALRVEGPADEPADRSPATSAVDLVLVSGRAADGGGGGMPMVAEFDFPLATDGGKTLSLSLSAAGTADSTAVHRARDTLRTRLAKLEQNLPPRPITVARQLLETVWLTYDTETPPSRSHWLDIMAETNFESVFG